MKALYAFINPIVKGVLKSPFHGLLSGNTMVLSYQGRKSGRQYELPISYMNDGDCVCSFAERESSRWRNMIEGAEVGLRLAGRSIIARPRVEAEDQTKIAMGLARFLEAVPRDSGPAGVRMRSDGTPEPADVSEAAKRLAAVYFEPV